MCHLRSFRPVCPFRRTTVLALTYLASIFPTYLLLPRPAFPSTSSPALSSASSIRSTHLTDTHPMWSLISKPETQSSYETSLAFSFAHYLAAHDSIFHRHRLRRRSRTARQSG